MLKLHSFTKICLKFAVAFLISATLQAEPLNLSIAKQQVIAYHDSGAYEKEIALVIANAERYLNQQAKIKNRQQCRALIFDIDETALSNYEAMKRNDFNGNSRLFHQEIMKGDAKVIQPTRSLYQQAKRLGFKVYFISGRDESERQVTIKNLKQAGYQNFDGLYLRKNGKAPVIPALVFKTELRKRISEKGCLIVASIGDQMSDLGGGYSEMGFKLPNPYYFIP